MTISYDVQIGKYFPIEFSLLEKEFDFNISQNITIFDELKFTKVNSQQYVFQDELIQGGVQPLFKNEIKAYAISLIEKKYGKRLVSCENIKLKKNVGEIIILAKISFIPVFGSMYLMSWKKDLIKSNAGTVKFISKSKKDSLTQISLTFTHGLEIMIILLRNKSNDKIIRKLTQGVTAYDQLAYISLLVKEKKCILRVNS